MVYRGARPAGDSSLDTEWEDKLQANAEYDREDMDHFSGFADLENEWDLSAVQSLCTLVHENASADTVPTLAVL